MNITFLVGNGFEIAAGMKTSYQDFYEWYRHQPSSNDRIFRFKREIGTDIIKRRGYWADLELGLGKYTENYSISNIAEYLECCDDIQNSIVQYIETEQKRFKHSMHSGKAVSDISNGLAYFYDELSDIEFEEIDRLYNAEGISHNVLHFISFNYTDSLDSIIKHFPQYHPNKLMFNKKVIHVHGLLNDNPILGVNDASQIANRRFRHNQDFCNRLIKSRLADRVGQKGHSDAKKAIKQSSIICVFGMSLGKTDALWWEMILKWLSEDNSRHLIIYWYISNTSKRRSASMTVNDIDNVKKLLRQYMQFSESIETVMDRVHVIINTQKVLSISPK